MKTLICQEQIPLYITNPIIGKQRNPTLHPTQIKNPYFHTKTRKLQAKAKGFGGAPTEMREQLSTSKEPDTRKGSRRNDDDNDEKLPDVVFERMIVRTLFNVGVPFVTGLALLQGFSVVKEEHLWDVPVWLPFLTTFITFGVSTLGVAFGALSTSWDAEKEGSLLGFEEAQRNWVEIWREEDRSNE